MRTKKKKRVHVSSYFFGDEFYFFWETSSVHNTFYISDVFGECIACRRGRRERGWWVVKLFIIFEDFGRKQQ